MPLSMDNGQRELFGIEREQFARRGSLFTAEEIAQQPRIWREAQGLVLARSDEIAAFMAPQLALAGARVCFCGAGTSAFIGDTVASWLKAGHPSGNHVDFESISTTDIVGDPSALGRDRPTIMVSFSRSGDSPESVAAVDLANRKFGNCRHLIFTCNPEGELAKYADQASNTLCLNMPEGTNDRGFAMTSSYSSMLVSCISTFAPAPEKLDLVARRAQQFIDRGAASVAETAARTFDRLVVLGSGLLAGTAREAALKCAELASGNVVAISDTPLGFRHGPKIMVSPGTLILQMISSDPYTSRYDLDLLSELRSDARAGWIVELSARQLMPGDEPELDDIWLSLLYILNAQVFAFLHAWSLGVAVDTPCSSGEVNRIVKGVVIHPYER